MTKKFSGAYSTRLTCRLCDSSELVPLFSLGEQFVSDFVEPAGHAYKVPIDLVLCKNCTLVQQKHTAPQDFLYTRHYWYRSGVTATMRAALKDVAESALKIIGPLTAEDLVLDIGSNDGELLTNFPKECWRVGVEPANNLATASNYGNRGLHLIHDFWSREAFRFWQNINWRFADGEKEYPPLKAKVILAIGMFYDLEDPNSFIADVAKCLSEDGVFIAQLQCLKQTVELGDVGNFCHEHLEFYSLESLKRLMNNHGLAIFRIEENKVNGGSYRLFVRHAPSGLQCYSWKAEDVGSVILAEEQERKMNLADPVTYRTFFDKMLHEKHRCVSFIEQAVGSGKSVYVLGASTKGNVILQWLSLDSKWISGASDRSPEKWGKYTVGTGIRIYSEEESRNNKPDYFLVLPYAFRNELMERER